MSRRYPFLLLLAGLLGGMGAAAAGAPLWTAAVLILAAAIIYLFLLHHGRTIKGAVMAARYHAAWIITAAAALGVATWIFHAPCDIKPMISDKTQIAVATIEESHHAASGSKSMIAKITAVTDDEGNVVWRPRNLLAMLSGDTIFDAGTEIIFMPDLQPLTPSANFQNDPGYRYLQSLGVVCSQWLVSGEAVVTKHPEGSLTNMRQLHQHISSKLASSALEHPASALIAAIALGDRSSLSHEQTEDFRNSGLSHLLALSGMHMGVIAMLLTVLTMPLAPLGLSRARWLLIITALWFFTIFTGCQTAAVRACIMMTFCFGALILERKNVSLNALMAAAFFILILSPRQITSPGFQLSFTAAGLLMLTSGLNPVRRHSNPVLYSLTQTVIVSLTAMTGTMALTAYHFHNLPLGALLPNIVAAWMMPPYLTVALVYVLFLTAGTDSAPLRWILEKGYELLADMTAGNSGSAIDGVWINGAVPLLSIGTLICILLWLRCARNIWGWSAAAFLAASAVVAVTVPGSPPADGFIVQKTDIDKLLVYDNGLTKYISPAGENPGEVTIHGRKVIWGGNLSSIPPGYDYYLLCSGSRLPEVAPGTTVVIMPTLRGVVRHYYREQCIIRGLRFHDIIADGPLWVSPRHRSVIP